MSNTFKLQNIDEIQFKESNNPIGPSVNMNYTAGGGVCVDGFIAATTGVSAGNIRISDNSIKTAGNSPGDISFANDNLSTTGTVDFSGGVSLSGGVSINSYVYPRSLGTSQFLYYKDDTTGVSGYGLSGGNNITLSYGENVVTITGTGGGSGASPAGSDTQIQYNNNSSFGADSSFTWSRGTSTLGVTGGISVQNGPITLSTSSGLSAVSILQDGNDKSQIILYDNLGAGLNPEGIIIQCEGSTGENSIALKNYSGGGPTSDTGILLHTLENTHSSPYIDLIQPGNAGASATPDIRLLASDTTNLSSEIIMHADTTNSGISTVLIQSGNNDGLNPGGVLNLSRIDQPNIVQINASTHEIVLSNSLGTSVVSIEAENPNHSSDGLITIRDNNSYDRIKLQGSDGFIVFNNGGTFGGNLTFGMSTSHTIGTSFILPINNGLSGQVLQTDGNGNLSFVNQSGGGASPAAPTNSVQFNNGTSFGGSSDFTYNPGTSTLGVSGNINMTLSGISQTGITINSDNQGLGPNFHGVTVNHSNNDPSAQLINFTDAGAVLLNSTYGAQQYYKAILGSNFGPAQVTTTGSSGGHLALFGENPPIVGPPPFTFIPAVDLYVNSDGDGILSLHKKVSGGSGPETLTLNGTSGNIIFRDTSGTGVSTTLGISSSQTESLSFTLPGISGSSGQAIVTDGSGNLSFATISGGGGASPADPTNSVQFNNNGSFDGSSDFTYNTTTSTLGVSGIVSITGSGTSPSTITLGGTSGNIIFESGLGGTTTLGISSGLSGTLNFILPGTSGTSGQAIVTDGFGNLSFETIGGASSITDLNDAYADTSDGNLFLGVVPNVGLGITGSTAVGICALGNDSNGGNSNTAVGHDAGKSITIGIQNTIVGEGALENEIEGSYSTAIGYLALSNQKVLPSGEGSLYNTALGWQAGFGLSVVTSVFTGPQGIYNTFIGASTGTTLGISGSNLTVLGYNAQPSTLGVSNEVTLGNRNVTALRCAESTIASLSDARDKNDIRDLPYGLNFLENVRPVEFTWDKRLLTPGDENDPKQGKRRAGFIAQELQEAMPDGENDILDLVYESNPQRLEAKYGNLIPVMVKAIQDLKAEVDTIKEHLNLE